MGWKTSDYIDMGTEFAKKALDKPKTMKVGSWQYQAFMAGYKTQMGIQSGLTPLEASKAALNIQATETGRICGARGNSCGCYPEGDGTDLQCPDSKTGLLGCEDGPREKSAPNSLRKPGKPQPLPAGHPAHKYFEGWPSAAVEHVRFLALQLADESNPARQKRLMKSFGRVYKRHQGDGVRKYSMLGAQSALGMFPA